MEQVKVFLNDDRAGNVICQKCGNLKPIRFQNAEIPRTASAKCKCGNVFTITFEKRQFYRKQISVTAKCLFPGNSAETLVKLIDVSQGGLCFVKPVGKSPEPNDIFKFSFEVGNGVIHGVAQICNVRNDRIGAHFTSMDEHSKKVLGFFLMP